MTKQEEAEAMAEEYKQLVHKRTGLKSDELSCPREKSEMTPCIARDGKLAVASGQVCVGCDHRIKPLLENEKAKH